MIILQNAYGVEDGYVPSFEKENFRRCHTGVRLKRAIPENINTRIINASPLVGKKSSANFKPDREYVKRMCKEIDPDIILACGVNAKKAVEGLELTVPVIKMPHPAYRALKNETLDEVKEKIKNGYRIDEK